MCSTWPKRSTPVKFRWTSFDDSWDDAAITKSLTSIKGIGIWTAEMFLIFALNRPDILPVSDLGVRVGLRDRHGLAQLPAPRECHALAELWRPYRTIASWYIWRGTDTPIKRPRLVRRSNQDDTRPDLERRIGDRRVRWAALSRRRRRARHHDRRGGPA